jgi:predicted PurR-regulated permease PerM
VSGSEWAWIVMAAFFGLAVLFLCIVFVAVFRLLNQVTDLVHGVTDQTVPLLGGLNETVSGVNVELARVDTIIAGVQSITATADSLVGVVHATVSNPMIKTAAWVTGALAATKSAKKLKEEL